MARTRAGWRRWYDRWETQQESFNPTREARFATMLDLVEASLPSRFTALDLGSGPGALSARLLRRFPKARCVAVDYDPVVLRVGRGALGTFGGRLTWVDARLGSPRWTKALPRSRFDAALSTTALHWLPDRALVRLYADLGRLVRRGGIFLNGDRMAWGKSAPELSALAERVRKIRYRGASLDDEWAGWKAWWSAAERDPELRDLFPERERRQSQHPTHGEGDLAVHLRGLRRAGFSTVEVVWRHFENGILFARR
jgi:SAM-dependent methyltransferase